MKYAYQKKFYRLLASILDAAGGFLFGLGSLFASKSKLPRWKTVLIVRLDQIGDVLFASPAAQAIKKNYPDCRLYFLTASQAAPILEGDPFIDEVIAYDFSWHWNFSFLSHWADFRRLCRLLREKEIDSVFLLRGDIRENFMAWLAGIPVRIGYGITGGGFFLTRCVPYSREKSEAAHHETLLKSAGISSALEEPKLRLSEEEKQAARKKWEAAGLDLSKKCVGLHIDAGFSSKRWSERQAEILLKNASRAYPELSFILVGKLAESAYLSGLALDLRGKTSLRELGCLMSKMNAFIGTDSGPTHMAASLGVPTVYLYSGTNDLRQWQAPFKNISILKYEVKCSPCYLRNCPINGHPCMTGIEPASALEALGEFLK